MKKILLTGEKARATFQEIIRPAGNFFSKIGLHPNVLSITGLVLSIVAGIIYTRGRFFWAAWVVVLAGICDSLDGNLARETGKSSLFGAFLDSTLDRYGEMCILIGIAWYFAVGPEPNPWSLLFIITAMTGSFMVSYTRARAEGIGLECKVGLMQRAERMILLIIGSLLGSIPLIGIFIMKFTLLVLAVLSNITAIHRLIHVRKEILKENLDT